MQVCTLLQTDNHANTPTLVFTGRMPFMPPNQQRQSTEWGQNVLKTFEMAIRRNSGGLHERNWRQFSVSGIIFTYVHKIILTGPLTECGDCPHCPPMEPPVTAWN